MNLKNYLLLLFAFILLACQPDSETNASDGIDYSKTYKWRMVTHQIPGTARYESTITPFVKNIEEMTNGRLIIEPFGANVLFPTDETLDMVKNGTIEMAAIFTGFWGGKDPVFAIGTGAMPGDPTSPHEHFYKAQQLQPIIEKAYEKYGVKDLGPFDYAPVEILMSRTPINSYNDFKGKNIRSSGIANLFYSKLGASSTFLSAPEIYTGLQLGTIDAAEYNDFLVNQEMGLNEVTKYVIEPALHTGPGTDKELIVNPKAWENLPKDLQKAVLVTKDQAIYNSMISYEAKNKQAINEWIDSGVEIIYLPDDEVDKMREKAFELLNEYKSKSEASKEYIDGYAKVLMELGYTEEAEKLGYSSAD